MVGVKVYAIDVLVEFVIPFLFFFRVPDETDKCGRRVVEATACMLLLIPLFFDYEQQLGMGMNFGWSCVRFFYRALVYLLYVRIYRKPNWSSAVYLALLLTTVYTICQVFVKLPIVLKNFSFLYGITYIPLILICAWLLPLQHRCYVTKERVIVLTLVATCRIYTKVSLFTGSYNGGMYIEDPPVYFQLLHIFLLLFLIFFERYAYGMHQLESRRAQEIVNEHLYHGFKRREGEEGELRALHHDMKNHLLMIEEMARRHQCQEIQDYTNTLIHRSQGMDHRIRTGNSLLDAMLEEKFAQAAQEGISTSCTMDVRKLQFIDAVDLCVIFSNAVDNAMDACGKVEDVGKRYMRLSSTQAAGCLFVRIENSYHGTLKFMGKFPVTTKANPRLHGYGLSNINIAVEKYGGSVQMKAQDGSFVLVLMFPIQE